MSSESAPNGDTAAQAARLKEQGNQKFADKDYKAAIALYDSGLALEPENSVRGHRPAPRRRQPLGTRCNVRMAPRPSPRSGQALLGNKAACLNALQRFEEALEAADRAVAAAPTWSKVRASRITGQRPRIRSVAACRRTFAGRRPCAARSATWRPATPWPPPISMHPASSPRSWSAKSSSSPASSTSRTGRSGPCPAHGHAPPSPTRSPPPHRRRPLSLLSTGCACSTTYPVRAMVRVQSPTLTLLPRHCASPGLHGVLLEQELARRATAHPAGGVGAPRTREPGCAAQHGPSPPLCPRPVTPAARRGPQIVHGGPHGGSPPPELCGAQSARFVAFPACQLPAPDCAGHTRAVPEPWLEFYTGLPSRDKVDTFSRMWEAASPQEKSLIVEDLRCRQRVARGPRAAADWPHAPLRAGSSSSRRPPTRRRRRLRSRRGLQERTGAAVWCPPAEGEAPAYR